MSRKVFESYGERNRSGISTTQASGRYECQQEDEKRILSDVATKLRIAPQDDLLEIGCGPGNLLIPLSFQTRSVSGVDHPDAVDALQRRAPGIAAKLIPGDFRDIELPGDYSKILIYSVIHCLSNEEEAFSFIYRALSLLRPGGAMLIGDLPNIDRKQRFLNSESGRRFSREWAKRREGAVDIELSLDEPLFQPSDSFNLKVLEEVRSRGFESYVLAQPPNLPFGHTREDILILSNA